MQPTRVTASSATLIDNIFVNNLATESIGGNITTSISDHFSQFCAIDVLRKVKHISVPKRQRSYKNFSYVEFEEELKKIDWGVLNLKDSDEGLNLFFNTIDSLLDEMAPLKTLNKKEQKLQQMPWISGDILNYTHERDELHKTFLAENDIAEKEILFQSFKKK